jgi:hypothetical protein
MIRRLAIAGLIVAGLLGPLLAADPASAGSGVGCSGNDCSILLSKLIALNGDVGSGAGFLPIAVAPPPCLWEPIGDAVSGSDYIIAQWGTVLPNAPFGIYASVKQAKRLLKAKPPAAGSWYMLPVNPAASAAGRAACLKLPLFFFAAPGQPLPTPPIPPLTLAEYAYNHMLIPQPALIINPAAKGYVNLGTYVWGNWPASRATGQMNAYKITATLGNLTVTVWAQAAAFTVNVTGPGMAFSRGCGPTGSHSPVGKPPASAGPGIAPDCGVLWQAPTTSAALTATVRWVVTWGVGNLAGPGGATLPPILMTGPAPPLQFPVAEIQSVTGG